MEIFNNQMRSGYEEIVSYGPRWWTEYREMDAVYRFEGWLLDLMAVFLEKTVNNQFPSQADAEALAMYERILNLMPDESATLEERRREVAAYYSGTGKLSRTVLKNLIRNYTGCESEMWWDASNLHIRVFMVEEKPFSSKKIYNIISRRMPAYLEFLIREVLATFELPNNRVDVRPRYRFTFPWWEGHRMLDGEHKLDGSYDLSVAHPPMYTTIRHRMDAGEKDDMSFTMYVPAKAKKLDGTFSLNGNILLNSGREVL